MKVGTIVECVDDRFNIEQLEKIPNRSLQEIKNKYFNKIVTDGIDDLHVTKIHFTPTGLSKEDYIVDLIDDDYEASQFLKL